MQSQESVSTPSVPSNLLDLVSRMPRPAEKGQWPAILSDVDGAAVRAAVEQLHAGGRESVVGLVFLIAGAAPEDGAAEAGDEDGQDDARRTDSQARHALHALVTYACGKGEESRRAVSAALASTLNGRVPKGVQAFVARQLVLCGGREAAGALGRLLADESLYADAAMALEKIGGPDAAAQFRAALDDPRAAQWPPRQRAAAAKGLGVLRDAKSAPQLRRLAADAEAEVRLAALWGLARIGDAESIELLTKAADAAQGGERFRATDACLLLAESLEGAGRKDDATRIYRHLHDTRTAPEERYLRQVVEPRA